MARLFGQLVFDPRLFELREMIDKDFAIQMIDLVLNTDRQQATGFQHLFLAVQVLIAHTHIGRTINLIVDPRHRQAAFFIGLHTRCHLNHRIDKNLQIALILGNVDHHHALMHIDLRCRQTNAWRFVHGLRHIFRQSAQGGIKHRHRLGHGTQTLIGKSQNRE